MKVSRKQLVSDLKKSRAGFPLCVNGRPPKGAALCLIALPARKGSKKKVLAYRLPSGQTIGFLGKRCTTSWEKSGAVQFDRPKEAEAAGLGCASYVRKPGGKDPELVYARARKLP